MTKLTSIGHVKEIMDKYGIGFSKGLGQNFLVDEHALDTIVGAAKVCADDWVLEVGPGIGTLTQALATKAHKVTAVEIDETLLPVLKETLAAYANIEVIREDILRLRVEEVAPKQLHLKVVANLPYYITSPIIFHLLESEVPWERLVFLMQKEVAERIAATSGSKVYGAPSVTIQAQAKAQVYDTVSRGCFMPRPTVDSAILVLQPYTDNPYNIADYDLFTRLVRSAFNQRRKTLINALNNVSKLPLDKQEWRMVMEDIGIEPRIRAEKLEVQQFADLSNALARLMKA